MNIEKRNSSTLPQEWKELVMELIKSDVSKEEFKAFIEARSKILNRQ
jgi:hypothetical protein